VSLLQVMTSEHVCLNFILNLFKVRAKSQSGDLIGFMIESFIKPICVKEGVSNGSLNPFLDPEQFDDTNCLYDFYSQRKFI
jgi:hypothetical protein